MAFFAEGIRRWAVFPVPNNMDDSADGQDGKDDAANANVHTNANTNVNTNVNTNANANKKVRNGKPRTPSLDTKCWKWSPSPAATHGGSTSSSSYGYGFHNNDGGIGTTGTSDCSKDQQQQQQRRRDDDAAAATRWETFQRSNQNLISLGISESGAGAGLQLNSDLTVGETYRAVGFDNEHLVETNTGKTTNNPIGTSSGSGSNTDDKGNDIGVVFRVGLVEVYQLVREIDGRPAQ
eukprot:CAMPEP_0168250642 /NCGR_PEP_ID=MMETSP0141_2-20121125/2653_1 /TAXON_ID=44445 /ORGANISM="Pseudo-nitzschia australis, Strain 10249 10 AB" /LENGTH=235 /DNA_ID=CAMNT_0008186735 /DNA_START=159 /DNA_END=867 /DNA_ORIENTATION=+